MLKSRLIVCNMEAVVSNLLVPAVLLRRPVRSNADPRLTFAFSIKTMECGTVAKGIHERLRVLQPAVKSHI